MARALVESSLHLTIAPLASRLNDQHSSHQGLLRWTAWPMDDIIAELEYRLESKDHINWSCMVAFSFLDDIEPVEVRQDIPVVRTRPNFGGFRWWFLCPGAGDACGRRSYKLYLPATGSRFACRSCHGLAYASTQR